MQAPGEGKPTQSPHAPRNQLEEEPSGGAVESVPAFDEEEEDERKSLEKTVEEELEAARSRSANVHVIPTPACELVFMGKNPFT